MAWIELTDYEDTKFFANTDHFLSVEDYYSGGAQIRLTDLGRLDGSYRGINVKETKNQIENLTEKSDLLVREPRRVPNPNW